MSRKVKGNQKHMTTEDRAYIEEALQRNMSFKAYGDGAELYKAGEQHGLEEGDETAGIGIKLKMLPSEIKATETFEIVPVLRRYSSDDGTAFVKERVPRSEADSWNEEETELTDCALRFSVR